MRARCRAGSRQRGADWSRGATDSGRSSRRSTEPSARAIPALIAFSSSRTLPGQLCRKRACIASEAISVTGVPFCERCFSRKCIARSGMSSVRSRKGGQLDPDHVQAVEQVGAKPAFLDLVLQALVGGGDDPNVDLDALGPAHALERARLQHAKQLDLQAGRRCRRSRRAARFRRRPARSGRSFRRSAPVKAPFS